MSKIQDLIKEKCPNGVQYYVLDDIADTFIGLATSVTKYKEKEGIVLLHNSDIRQNKIILKSIEFISKDFADKNKGKYHRLNDIVTVHTGDVGTSAVISKEYVGSMGFTTLVTRIRNFNLINPHYLCYYFNSDICKRDIARVTISDRSNLNQKEFCKLRIPIPPVEVQEEIVRILDKFGELEAVLEAELEARQSQYEFWREKLFELDECEWKTTEELFDTITDYVANGSFKSIADNVSYKNEKDYAVLLRTVDYSNGYDTNKFIYIDEHAYKFLSKSKLFGGEIIINNIGAGVGTTFLCPDLGMPMSLAPNTIMMRTPNNKFYYYWFNSKRGQESIESVTAKSAMPKFNKTGFRKILVPVPTLEKQNKIVETLDKFEKLISDISIGLPAEIELRRKQYDYYRNKLLSFEELSCE